MCRHFAYLGPRVPLHELLFDAPHSLCSQARSPRHQTSGENNPDGWGVGWYPDGEPEPLRYRTVKPIWEDTEFEQESRSLESGAILAAARLASPGATIVATGNAPFLSGRWLCSLNGAVKDFHQGAGDQLRERVSARRLAEIEGDSDSEVLFALTLDRLDAGDAPADALASVVDDVLAITKARLNLVLTDGHTLAATRVGNSLFARGSLVSSEPVDGRGGWCDVPDRSLVVATAGDGGSEHTISAL
jgi:gamma-glutamyl hercynylcysteine S-oxide hydrolase